ncbi:SDR family NAD(P)-dependent oxidoreductase [Mycobacterium manitobense]|uniref:SDR family NAD(P)-dependent oxidoreductase n=2 Tax=[Mycobacterium] manitobense TaxID=190147 RepID=A0A9X2YLD4_9MYCO|nr:SDR family NAD(P)-dependent oxidoreductase [[Mycobacterium] manitobense]MCV7169391.1 SDR family NAD(P)-dependent oxidoreductase [[Mycobacterium] manitobense]
MSMSRKKSWVEADVPDQTGRVAVVTGANTGLGYDTARVLAQRGAKVVLAVRNTNKGAAARDRILTTAPGAEVMVAALDLGSLQSVRDAAATLLAACPRIDLIVNNAGVMIPPKEVTVDGFELQFGTNYLGHFALTGLLLDRLMSVDGSRVVVVSSNAHKMGGAIHFDDLQWERSYKRGAAYAQSKLANLMFCYELQARLAAAGSATIAVAAHPGFTDSELIRHVWKPVAPLMRWAGPWVGQSPAMGALPQLLAATGPQVRGGQYWGPDGPFELRGYPTLVKSSARSHDLTVRRRLWAVAEQLTGVTFPV